MRIQVIFLTQDRNGEIVVSLKMALGVVSARWASKTQVPEIVKEYDVELDFDVGLNRKTNTRDADAQVPCLSIEGDLVVLQAVVESVDDDGMAYLRLAQDCLVMVETAGGISTGEAIRVSFPPSSLSVTVIGQHLS